jgi:hypothetical protein
VPEQLLDGLQRRAAHDQVRGEGVRQDVPVEQPETRVLAGAPQRMLHLPLVSMCPERIGEHERAAVLRLLGRGERNANPIAMSRGLLDFGKPI